MAVRRPVRLRARFARPIQPRTRAASRTSPRSAARSASHQHWTTSRAARRACSSANRRQRTARSRRASRPRRAASENGEIESAEIESAEIAASMAQFERQRGTHVDRSVGVLEQVRRHRVVRDHRKPPVVTRDELGQQFGAQPTTIAGGPVDGKRRTSSPTLGSPRRWRRRWRRRWCGRHSDAPQLPARLRSAARRLGVGSTASFVVREQRPS